MPGSLLMMEMQAVIRHFPRVIKDRRGNKPGRSQFGDKKAKKNARLKAWRYVRR